MRQLHTSSAQERKWWLTLWYEQTLAWAIFQMEAAHINCAQLAVRMRAYASTQTTNGASHAAHSTRLWCSILCCVDDFILRTTFWISVENIKKQRFVFLSWMWVCFIVNLNLDENLVLCFVLIYAKNNHSIALLFQIRSDVFFCLFYGKTIQIVVVTHTCYIYFLGEFIKSNMLPIHTNSVYGSN